MFNVNVRKSEGISISHSHWRKHTGTSRTHFSAACFALLKLQTSTFSNYTHTHVDFLFACFRMLCVISCAILRGGVRPLCHWITRHHSVIAAAPGGSPQRKKTKKNPDFLAVSANWQHLLHLSCSSSSPLCLLLPAPAFPPGGLM